MNEKFDVLSDLEYSHTSSGLYRNPRYVSSYMEETNQNHITNKVISYD